MSINSNMIHNILNVVIAVVGVITAFLIATGCVATETGALECSSSWVDPKITAVLITFLALTKTVMNVFRDGVTGLTRQQPPVR